MKLNTSTRPITIFTPSSADEGDTNAQNLTVKEIVARLPPTQFHVTMVSEGKPDPRIAERENTDLVRGTDHWNTVRLLRHCLFPKPDIYFFPRCGPLDRAFFDSRKYLGRGTALVSYIVMMMNDRTATTLISRSIVEADRVCTNSKYVADTVREKFGLDSTIVHDGIDARQPRKRVELVIQEAARWPNVRFRIAGRGETEERCRAMCQQHDSRNVSFLGHLSSRQLGDEMRKAHVFLFPSILEGHPQVLGQAAACGLPTIAMNLYRPDYVLHGETGFLAESDADLNQALDLLLRNSQLRQSMSSAALRHSRNFDWDQIAAQWMEIFREVVVERRAA
jgi:glycosyltransferase involved in cell wall biosynthesis